MAQINLKEVNAGSVRPQKNSLLIEVNNQQFLCENFSRYQLRKVYFGNCLWRENALLESGFVNCVFKKNNFESNDLRCDFKHSHLSSVRFDLEEGESNSDFLWLRECIIEDSVIAGSSRVDIVDCLILSKSSRGYYFHPWDWVHSDQLRAFYSFLKYVFSDGFGSLEDLKSNSVEFQARHEADGLEKALSRYSHLSHHTQLSKILHDIRSILQDSDNAWELYDHFDRLCYNNMGRFIANDARTILNEINFTSRSFKNTFALKSLKITSCRFTSHCFENTTIVSGEFIRCEFRGIKSNFNNATFDLSDFDHCRFYPYRKDRSMLIENCSFMGCNFDGTSFSNCEFKQVDFRYIQGVEKDTFISCTFNNCIFENEIKGQFRMIGEFKKCNFAKFSFAGLKVDACHFHETTFYLCDFRHVEFKNSTFDDVSYISCGF